MMISAALTEASPEARIAPTYDEAACVLIADSDDLGSAQFVTDHIPEALRKADVEVLLCGDIYSKEAFEQIAGYCITRYQAAGLLLSDAIRAMDRYELELIRDYVGGTGCSSHEGNSCSCGFPECG